MEGGGGRGGWVGDCGEGFEALGGDGNEEGEERRVGEEGVEVGV